MGLGPAWLLRALAIGQLSTMVVLVYEQHHHRQPAERASSAPFHSATSTATQCEGHLRKQMVGRWESEQSIVGRALRLVGLLIGLLTLVFLCKRLIWSAEQGLEGGSPTHQTQLAQHQLAELRLCKCPLGVRRCWAPAFSRKVALPPANGTFNRRSPDFSTTMSEATG